MLWRAFRWGVWMTLMGVAFLCACGGGGGPAPGPGEGPAPGPNVTGIWEGQWTSGQGRGSGIFCVELQQSGDQISGTLYIVGQGLVGDVRGQLNGNQITFGVAGGVQFSGTINGENASGDYQSPTDDNGTWTAQKTTKTRCDWASPEAVSAFERLLSFGLQSGRQVSGASLASFITVLPEITVTVNGQTSSGWLACIWELEDLTGNIFEGVKFTIGGAVSPDLTQSFVWSTPTIGPQETPLGGEGGGGAWFISDLNQDLTFPSTNIYLATGGTYRVTNANYQQNPFFSFPITDPPATVEVRMSELTWSLSFTGVNINNDQVNVEVPETTIPALFVQFR